MRGCRGDPRSSDVRIATVDAEAPVLIVQETHLHGRGPPSPTLALWADGQVLFAGTDDRLTTTLPPSTIATLARSAYDQLHDVPHFTSVFDISGGTLLRITVRHGDDWRSAALYGDDPERVLAVARGTAPLPKPSPPSTVTITNTGTYLLDAFAARPWPPLGFARAYRTLVEAIPSVGTPFTPFDYDVQLTRLHPAMQVDERAIAWPTTLPRVPAVAPDACHYDWGRDDEACTFIVPPAYSAAVAAFTARVVRVDGRDFVASFRGLYRGARSIHALTDCADTLARRGGARLP